MKMRKFFTVIPLQGPGKLIPHQYQAVGNTMLQMDTETCFPILTAINGYVQPGEEFRLIAVMTDTEDGHRNRDALRQELDLLCGRKGLVCPRGIETVPVAVDDRVSTHVATFQKLIDLVDDDDELFACMTFGTKPLSTAVQMAVQYAYRVKRNASIACIVYGQIDRTGGESKASVYDMTALIQLDELVRVLADRGVTNPKEMIDRILSL